MHPLTADELPMGYVPAEGFNQGDNYSRERYRASCVPVTSAIPRIDHIRLPPAQDGTPVNVVVLSDDRRLIDPTIPGLLRVKDACVTATRSKGGMVNPGKLLFYHFQLVDDRVNAVSTPVPAYKTTTGLEPPLVAGISVFHRLPIESLFTDLQHAVRSLCSCLGCLFVNSVLSLWCVHAFAMTKIEYVSTGVHISDARHRPIAAVLHRTFCMILGLPHWSRRRFWSFHLIQGVPPAPRYCSGRWCASSRLTCRARTAAVYIRAARCRPCWH